MNATEIPATMTHNGDTYKVSKPREVSGGVTVMLQLIGKSGLRAEHRKAVWNGAEFVNVSSVFRF